MSVASFVAAAAYDAAQATLLGNTLMMTLTTEEYRRLAEFLRNPPEPNVAFRELFEDRELSR